MKLTAYSWTIACFSFSDSFWKVFETFKKPLSTVGDHILWIRHFKRCLKSCSLSIQFPMLTFINEDKSKLITFNTQFSFSLACFESFKRNVATVIVWYYLMSHVYLKKITNGDNRTRKLSCEVYMEIRIEYWKC